MDEVEFFKTTRRIYNTNTDSCASEIVAAVEKWAKEHPAKTRQSEFLKMFPNAALFGFGTTVICDICPAKVDDTLDFDNSKGYGCYGCKRKYWLAEVE